jgi:hypothetical protein
MGLSSTVKDATGTLSPHSVVPPPCTFFATLNSVHRKILVGQNIFSFLNLLIQLKPITWMAEMVR